VLFIPLDMVGHDGDENDVG